MGNHNGCAIRSLPRPELVSLSEFGGETDHISLDKESMLGQTMICRLVHEYAGQRLDGGGDEIR